VADESSASAKYDNPQSKQQQPAKTGVAASTTEPLLGDSSDRHRRDATSKNPDQNHGAELKTKQHKRIPDENIAKLIAEENESKSKFPIYPGLERWELVEKMGDGAFSNVYRARDREGILGEVAIKVVRKFEMNSLQVREVWGPVHDLASPAFLLVPLSFPISCQVSFTNSRAVLEQEASPSRLQDKSPKGCRGARNFPSLIACELVL
jgi:hypothetical protein